MWLPTIYTSAILCLFLYSSNVSKAHKFSNERVVDDIVVILSFVGVPVDFQYNQTSSANGEPELVSVPGCPKSIDGYPWIYQLHRISPDKSELRCHLLGSKGPCSSGQVLYLQSGTMHGICGCECLLNEPIVETSQREYKNQPPKQNLKLCYSSSVPQGQVYDVQNKSVCYNIGEQGPCQNGEVLAIPVASRSSKDDWICLPICDDTDDDWITKRLNGDCAELEPETGAELPKVISSHDCPAGEKFSSVLRKCVKQNPEMHYVIG